VKTKEMLSLANSFLYVNLKVQGLKYMTTTHFNLKLTIAWQKHLSVDSLRSNKKILWFNNWLTIFWGHFTVNRFFCLMLALCGLINLLWLHELFYCFGMFLFALIKARKMRKKSTGYILSICTLKYFLMSRLK